MFSTIMKRLFYILALCGLLVPVVGMAWKVPDESLHYSVRYKWGFLDANAGVVKLTTQGDPADSSLFMATMSGKSVNLLGHYYEATDTLTGTYMADTVCSVYTQQVDKADGEFDIETVSYPGASNAAKLGPVVKQLPGGKVLRKRVSHYGGGVTVDLLGVFYYMRQLDYPSMKPGENSTVNLVDSTGTFTSALDITYNGPAMADSCGTQVPAYSITLTFGQPNGSEKPVAMTALISRNHLRVPLAVQGSLKFGHIQAKLIEAAIGDSLVAKPD